MYVYSSGNSGQQIMKSWEKLKVAHDTPIPKGCFDREIVTFVMKKRKGLELFHHGRDS